MRMKTNAEKHANTEGSYPDICSCCGKAVSEGNSLYFKEHDKTVCSICMARIDGKFDDIRKERD
jgi:hypothetical protein